MTRVEELTIKLMDGELPDAEAEELHRLLSSDEEAVKTHVRLLEIEGELRGERATLELSRGVLERIDRLRDERIEKGVMAQIHAISPWRKPTRRAVRPAGTGAIGWALAGIAAAALLLFAVLTETRRDPAPLPRITVQPRPKPEAPPVVVPPEKPEVPFEKSTPPPTPRPDPAPAPVVVPEKPLPIPAPPPEKPAPAPKPEDPPPAPRPPAETVVAIAELETVTGDVQLLSAAGATAARSGQGIAAGQGFEAVGAKSSAVLKFADGTRLRLENGLVRQVDEGKRIVVSRGVLHADVARQPAGKSVTILTPQAEAKVLGTKFALHVVPTWSRLEVQEGKVRLSQGAAAVDVSAGHFALAAPGIKLTARPMSPGGAVAGFVLVNLDNGLPIPGFDPMPDNAVLNLATLPTKNVNIRTYTAFGVPGSMRFELDGPATSRVESTAPFELASEFGRNLFAWPPTPGVHVLTATPFSGPGATGAAGGAWTITFRVVDKK